MMGPTFSIVMPVYKVAKYLREGVGSVLKQTFGDFEIVLIDDGSPDECPKLCDDYAFLDSRIRVVHQPNSGVSAARNRGIESAKGEWLFFLDPDDVLHPLALADCLRGISSHPSTEVIAVPVAEYVDGEVCGFDETMTDFEAIDVSDAVPRKLLFAENFRCFYRRTAIGDIRFRSYTIAEDQLFKIEVLLGAVGLALVADSARYGYRHRAGSATTTIRSTRALIDDVRHVRDAVLLAVNGVKKCDFRDYSVKLIDDFGQLLFQCADRSARREFVSVWRECLRVVLGVGGFSSFDARIAAAYLGTFGRAFVAFQFTRFCVWHKCKDDRYSTYFLFGCPVFRHRKKSSRK